MSDINSLLWGDSTAKKIISDSQQAGALFSGARWEDIGRDKELTGFLQRSLDPNGSKYNGDIEALKADILNTRTARGSSALASVWDMATAHGEGVQAKQFENLIGRLYEQAPNRLVSGNLSDTYEAVKSGLVGGVLYDAPLLGITSLATKALGVGAKGIEATAKLAAQKKAAELAAGDLTAAGLEAAGQQLSKDVARQALTTEVKREAAVNAGFGVVGDVAQQSAAIERGNQDEYSGAQTAMNAVGGAAIGGVLAGVTGFNQAKRLGGRMADDMSTGATAQHTVRLQSEEAARQAAKETEVPADMVTLADAKRDYATNIQNAADEVAQLRRAVESGAAKSDLTPQQLSAVHDALVRARTADTVADAYQSQASFLRSSPNATPEELLQAAALEQKATSFNSLAQFAADPKFHEPSMFVAGDVVNPELLSHLARLDDKLAAALAPPAEAATAAGKKVAAAAAPTAPSTPAAATTPAVQPAPNTQAAAPNTATPAASSAPTEAAKPTPTEAAATTPPAAKAGDPTAADVANYAETKFTPEEKAAHDSINGRLAQSNIDLQAVLDTMRTKGQTQAIADVAKATGTERSVIQKELTTVTAATQREHMAAATAQAAPEQVAAPEASTAAVEPAGGVVTPVADKEMVDAVTKLQEGIAEGDRQMAALEAERQAIIAERDAAIAAQDTAPAVERATEQHGKIISNLNSQLEAIRGAIDKGLADVTGDLPKEEIAAKVKESLDNLREKNPDVAPLLDNIDTSRISSKQGAARAMAKLKTLADDSITWTYANTIGKILPDAFDFGDFDTVLRAMLGDSLSVEAERISAGYRKIVSDSIAKRISEVGIDVVMRDPKLSKAWASLAGGTNGVERFGGVAKGAKKEVGEIVNLYIGKIIEDATASGETNDIILALTKGQKAIGAALRDQLTQLSNAGIPLDSQFVQDVLHIRAQRAAEDLLAGTFEKANAGDYEKLAKLRELRKQDRSENQTQSANRDRMRGSIIDNPIVHRITDDGESGWSERVVMASGRTMVNGKPVRAQSILSDGISDWLGTLWAHPRKMFSATAMAYRAIHGAAVDVAGWGRASMIIDGVKVSGLSLKEVKGRFKEGVAPRMEQARFGLILDAAERTRLEPTDKRYLGMDAYKAQLDSIGKISRPVTEEEAQVANLFLDSQERIKYNTEVVRGELADILAKSREMGDSPAEAINALVDRLDLVLKKNQNNTVEAMKYLQPEAADTSRSKTVKSADGTTRKEGATKGQKPFQQGDRAILRGDSTDVVFSSRDSDPIIVSVGGVKHEFVPSYAVRTSADGAVSLWGTKIGKWEKVQLKDGSGAGVFGVHIKIDGINTEAGSDLTSIFRAKSTIKKFRDLYEKNAKNMTEAKPSASAVPEGAQVAKEVGNTAEVEAAQRAIKGNPASEMLSQKVSSFDVPADRKLVIRSKATGEAASPGPLQGGMTIEAFAKRIGIAPEDIEVGTIMAGDIGKGGKFVGKSRAEQIKSAAFTPWGRDTGTVDNKIVEKLVEKKEQATMVQKAQQRPISMEEADQIEISGKKLGDIANSFDQKTSFLKYEDIATIEDLEKVIAELQATANLIESAAPHGVRRNNVSRRQSFHSLDQAMAGFSAEEKAAALDFLRRVEAEPGQLPYFLSGDSSGFSPRINSKKELSSAITIGKEGIGNVPRHIEVIHEVAHWAFMNMLSPSERVEFLASLRKHYDADGQLSMKSLTKTGYPIATDIEKATKKLFNGLAADTNELFAWQFVQHYLGRATGEAGKDAEMSLWQKVAKVVKAVIGYFKGDKVDRDLVPLFEKILPSTPSDKRYAYDAPLDARTGKPLDVSKLPASQKVANPIIATMEQIDNLRGNLRQHLLIPGGSAHVGFSEDLRTAAKHMFGLLYGREQVPHVSKLREKLNPMREASKSEAQAMGNKDEWLRDSKGHVVKDANGHGVRVSRPLEGAIDPRQLFSRNDTGKLIQLINDVTPEHVADNVAFEAVAGAEEFSAVVKDMGGIDTTTANNIYLQELQAKFKELTGKDMAGVSADKASFYHDALEKAQIYANTQVRKYAAEEFHVDMDASLFDDAGKLVLGTDAQRAALRGAALKLHDLMSDALDHFNYQLGYNGVALKRVTRDVPAPEPEVSKAAEKSVARVSRSRKKAPTVEPTTDAGKDVAQAEQGARTDGVGTGVPAAAPPDVKAVVARIPHRDSVQAELIGAAMSRLIHFVTKGEHVLTNADVARITGVELEHGVNPEAVVSSTTSAFDALRKGMRLMSEDLTNSTKEPDGALDFIVDLIIRDRLDTIKDDLGVDQHGNSFFMRGDVDTPVTVPAIKKEIAFMMRGIEVDPMLVQHLSDILEDSRQVVSGLGQTAAAKRVTGPTVKVLDPNSAFPAGVYHPSLVKATLSHKLAQMPQYVADHLVSMLGLRDAGGAAKTLAHNIVYSIEGTKRFFTSTDELIAAVEAMESKHPSGETLALSRAEMAKAAAKGDYETAMKMADMYEAAGGIAIEPHFVDMGKVYDPAMASVVEKEAVEEAVASGKFKTRNSALKSLGYIGERDGDNLKLHSIKSARSVDATIAEAVDSAGDASVPDAPLLGEIVLNMSIAPEAGINPLAVEQRATASGASSLMAGLLGNMFKKDRPWYGVAGKAADSIRKYRRIQLSSNSARIRRVGGNWLADLIHPIDGTGIEESFSVRLSSGLQPLINDMLNLSGVDTWWKKVGFDIYRNLNVSKHAVPQAETLDRIVHAMRADDVSKLSLEERKVAQSLSDYFRKLREEQLDADIPVGDASNGSGFYLPQRFNQDWIRANYDEAIDRMAKWLEKDRRERGVSTMKSREDAASIINEAIYREELQGIIDSSSSTYAQAFGDKLHQRKLNISGKDWESMGLLFDNNLQNLVTSYAEAANRRLEWVDRFGIRGHAASTYTDIAERGAQGAARAIMGSAQGMKTVLANIGEEVSEFDSVSNTLFNSVVKDEVKAYTLVKEIMDTLDSEGRTPGVRAKLADMLTQYHEQNGGGGVRHFRKHAEAIVNGLADFGDAAGRVASHEVEFMRKMVGVMGGRPAYTISANMGVRKVAAGLKTFNAVSLLGGAVISSLADPGMPLLRSGSMQAWLKGMASAAKMAQGDPALADAMARVGVTIESTLHDNLSNVSGGVSGRISNAFFSANLLTPWTKANRQVAALVGFESIKANQIIVKRERFNGTMDSYAYRRAMKYLRELGLAELVTAPDVDNFAMAVDRSKHPMGNDIAKAIHRFTNEAVFQPNRNDSPLWTQDPIAGLFWQFKSYPMMMGRLAKKNFKDAISFEKGNALDAMLGKDVGKYDGDPMGLMYLLTVGAALGYGASAAKDVVWGKNQEAEDGNWHSARAHSITKMAQDMGFKDFSMDAPGADVVLGSIAHGLLSLGTLGFLGDMAFQTANSLDNGAYGRERIMSQIAGPTLGTFSDTIQIVDGVRSHFQSDEDEDTGTAQERNAVRKVIKRVPFVGGVNPWVEAWVDGVAGEAINPPRQRQ